jgi:hypothetical protein
VLSPSPSTPLPGFAEGSPGPARTSRTQTVSPDQSDMQIKHLRQLLLAIRHENV